MHAPDLCVRDARAQWLCLFSTIVVCSGPGWAESPTVASVDVRTEAWMAYAGAATRVMVVAAGRDVDRTSAVSRAVEGVGGRVLWASAEGLRVDAMLTPAQASILLGSPSVASLELWSEPAGDGPIEREVSGAIVLENELGLTGAGVVGGVTDRGLLLDHVEFQGREPTLQTANTEALEHGTATYGILFANGNDALATGMLPDSVGVFASYDLFDDRDLIISELFGPARRGVFQSNSWGGARTRAYSTASAEIDDIVFRRDALLVQSQSNTGDQDSRPEAWAKNVVAVGGVDARGTVDLSDDVWSGGASTGPSLDGRVKPELVHFNGGVLTTDDDAPDAYLTFGGTSASTPVVAGVFGLFFELWATGSLGNPVSGGDAWAERPSSALARAMLINTASPYPFSSPADDMGRFRQGWGVPDIGSLWAARDALTWSDQAVAMAQDEHAVFRVVSEGGRDLRVTMVYTDPPSAPFQTRTLINDLDLVVESPAGVVYRGNSGLFDGVWSTPRGRPDGANTVENVFVSNRDASPGVWVVRVLASGIAEDGDLSTVPIDQSFALVVSGASLVESPAPTLYLAEPLPERTDGPWSIRVGVAGQPAFDTLRLIERRAGAEVASTVLAPSGHGEYVGPGPIVPCRGVTDIRIEAVSGTTVVAAWPSDGSFHVIHPGDSLVALETDFASPGAWSASGEPVRGGWEWASPSGGGLQNDPAFDTPWDSDSIGACWVTENGPGLRDVSGGPALLESPVFDLAALAQPMLTYAAWVACDDAGIGMPVGVPADDEDVLVVSASNDDGATWVEVDRVRSTFRWSERSVSLAAFAGDPSVKLRFEISDIGDNSMTEAAIDAVRVASPACGPCPADLDGNGQYDLDDIDAFILLFLESAPAVDFDGTGVIDLDDVDVFIRSALEGCG
ncbi:MAG: S8 family serine peptidase [Planctomycetota bacterium]